MDTSLLGLLKTRRFLPLFVTQFLGAFNDNTFKNALVILITYRLAVKAGLDARLLVTAAAGVFILPFFLFSAVAGQLADRLEKSRLIAIIKFIEIVLMALAALGYFLGDVTMLMVVLFLMGAQSTFFGPLKFAILPDHLREDELIGGNALIEAGTFLAILLGTVFGGLLILTEEGVAWVSVMVIGVALAGWLGSLFIPAAGPADPDLAINPNILGETAAIIRHAAANRAVYLSILGISWFWFVGATFLAQFPTYAKDIVGGNEQVVTLFLVTFSVGIGAGTLLCNRVLKGEVTAKYVPLGAIGMTLFSVDLYFASAGVSTAAGLLDAAGFLSVAANWRILADLALISICGGFYIVPLYAILQSRSEVSHRSRNIAANNIVNAAFMVASAVITAAMLYAEYSVTQVFLAMAVGNGVVAVYICKLLPDEVLRAIMRWLFSLAYRVEVTGLENYKAAGERAVIVVNHTSFLDAALVGACLPETPTFAIDSFIARKWWVKPAFLLFDLIAVDPTNPMAAKSLVGAVKQGKKCVIFPEGRITVTGALMKVYEGPGMIADLAGALILPICIEGAQFTPFSRLKGKLRLRWFPKIRVRILKPRRFEVPADIKGRRRRQIIGARLYDLMSDMMFVAGRVDTTLFGALLEARGVHGGTCVVAEDIDHKPLTYNRLITSSLALGRKLARGAGGGEYVGVLLPNSVAVVIAFFALQAFGRVPAMLNFATGVSDMVSACKTARVGTVLTSRRFVTAAKLDAAIEAMAGCAEIVYLEDIHEGLGVADKLFGVVVGPLARVLGRWIAPGVRPDDGAVVLFTSGSEGIPKGVVLSHANFLANRAQLSSRVDFSPTDIVFNALPVFHSFGLTGGLLLPLLSGIKTFLYPSPLHYRVVPELAYACNATILFGTDTFLAGYARAAHAYDFYSVRHVFAGAERLREETRRAWAEKFGLRILEGYGLTEAAPVVATNTPMHYKAGTVGRILPGIRHRLVEVPGIAPGGRLEVAGPNIMLGYLKADRPGEIVPPEGGWHDTGDIVEIDGEGFVSIVGRVKRFAKIAGEMVSLTAVEGKVGALWPDHGHVVVGIPDAVKGEQLVLVTEAAEVDRSSLQAGLRDMGVVELMIPKTVITVDKVPVLPSGKADVTAAQQLAEDAAAKAGPEAGSPDGSS
jgi:acyl-[acyl-carrier-protein]-phospholipid O-acyltransferase/long-chain-fatty-acid--[acyl-carrier-protein] ligase